MNLSDLLTRQAEAHADRPFLRFERQPGKDPQETAWRRDFSYREFDAEVNRAARYLLDLGLRRGDVFNLHLPNAPSFLLLWFAGARIGATMMPTNVLASADEMRYLLEHSGSRFAFATSDHAAMLNDIRRCLPCLREVVRCDPFTDSPVETSFEAAIAGYSRETLDSPADPGDLAAIMYTSGTTSRPKGVMVTHENYIKAGATVADAVDLSAEDRQFVVLPLFHGNAQYYSTMSALLRGASIALMDRFSASRYFDRCIAHDCTVASLFAAPIRMILAQAETGSRRDNRLRVVLYAQNLEQVERDQWNSRFGAPLCQLWGMTETMGPPLINPLHGERRNHTVGLPAGGYQIRLVDDDGKPVSRGETGEIVVQGEPGRTVMAGYFRNPEATRETLREGWLYTGDNAVQDAAGYFRFVDRKKDMIKRSGENVSASEVEGVLLRHPAVFESAVIGLPDPVRDERIVAVVVLHRGEAATAEELIAFCAERLASFRVPEQVVFRRQLPRTSVGKIQKHRIRREMLLQDV
jgi:crotonobetaine/carnitine-CoA ligase